MRLLPSLFLGSLLAAFCTQANASFIKVELDHSVSANSPDWNGPGPLPSALTVSFVLDTMSAQSVELKFATLQNGTCLTHFSFGGLSIYDVRAVADGTTVWQSSSLQTGFGGDNPGSSCPGGYFAGMIFGDDSHRFLASQDVFPGMSLSDFLSSTDPLRDLFFGFQRISGFAVFGSPSGEMLMESKGIRVSEVPEPATLSLLVMALASMALVRRVSSKRCLESAQRRRSAGESRGRSPQ